MIPSTKILGRFPLGRIILPASALTLLLVMLWGFPTFWYTNSAGSNRSAHFTENHEIKGWHFKSIPVGEAAEAQLAADRFFNGEFERTDGKTVRVFSADASADHHSAAMFSHTPDRCWTASGWKLKLAAPDMATVDVHGVAVQFERRIFTMGSHRELVYFGALIGGSPFPERLNQYYDLALGSAGERRSGFFGTLAGFFGARFVAWPWRVFVNRVPVQGAKQFLRVSTSVGPIAAPSDDALLQQFLNEWLVRSAASSGMAAPKKERARKRTAGTEA